MTRRLRALLVMTVTWAAGWAVIGLGTTGLQAVALGDARMPIHSGGLVLLVALRWAATGAVAGALFAAGLWLAGRRGATLGALPPRRVAVWGAAIGAGIVALCGIGARVAAVQAEVPLAVGLVWVVIGAAVGATTGAALVALARRAPELAVGESKPPTASPPSPTESLELTESRSAPMSSRIPASRLRS
jgi:hypothetical protein